MFTNQPSTSPQAEPYATMGNYGSTNDAAPLTQEERMRSNAGLWNISPETVAVYEAAIRNNTHMIGVEGHGEMVEGPKSCLDWFAAEVRGENPHRLKTDRTLVNVPGGYVKYLLAKAKERKREKLEREIAVLREKETKKRHFPFRRLRVFICLNRIASRKRKIDWL
ncbi:hypothetical protein IL306_004516 [Fusarium sp. DS 682]|nr:hypothetical protein IL306_004516 [Fusarium sp. DS 682]